MEKATMTNKTTANEKDTAVTASQNENSKQIVLQESNTVKPYNQEQIDLIKKTVAKGATNDELKLFMVVANKTGLDPFTRQIHFVKRGDTGTFQVGIDGLRTIAERTGLYAGNDDPVFDKEINPTKATVTVYKFVKGVRCPFTATARWSQYYPGDKQGFMWKKMPHLMLGKCAEALALRKAFPNDLSGLYTDDEMAQSAVVEAKDVTVTNPTPHPAKHWDNKPETIQNPRTHSQPQKVEQKLSELGEQIVARLNVCFGKEDIALIGPEINKLKKDNTITEHDWEVIKPIYLAKLKELTE